MTLENAYKIGIKYGFTFNGVGPSLSLVDGKVGICIKLLDDNFGYIKRNYSFENEDEFEDFIKKYTHYLYNKDKDDIFITLENYIDKDAKIIYSTENEESAKMEVELKNKELLLKDIKSFFRNFINSLELLKGDIAEKILVEQDYYNKLDYYQKLLYKAFDAEYNEEVMHADKTYLDDLNEKIKQFDLNHKRHLSSIITENTTMEQLNAEYTNLYEECKGFLENEEYIKLLFDKLKFKNNIDSLDEMIEYLFNNPVADENTQEKLAEIKAKTKEEDYDLFKEQYNLKYLEKYYDVNEFYNEKIFGTEKIEYIEYHRKSFKDEKKIVDLKSLYDNLDDEQKIAINLVHSPLKNIVLYVIEQAYLKNKKFDFERTEFKKIYEKMVEGLKNGSNLVFKLKYFKNINLDNYDEFIKSIVKITKVICASYSKLPFDLKLYSLNNNACMICACDSAIKNGTSEVNIINAKEGCLYIYSPIKIIYDEGDNLYSTSANNNIIYFPRYLNSSKKRSDKITLNLYDDSYEIEKIGDKNLLIIDDFILDKSILYTYTDMFAKEKE